MCSGNFEKDPVFAADHRKFRYNRSKASYSLRGRYRRIGGKNCIYCGFKADTGDHVPSLFPAYTNGIVKGVVVSSCFDCNKFLGPFSSTCLRERATFLSLVYEKEIGTNPNAGSDWLEKWRAYELKAMRCKQRMSAINCNLLIGSAALLAENGESGGETTSYDSLAHVRDKPEELDSSSGLNANDVESTVK